MFANPWIHKKVMLPIHSICKYTHTGYSLIIGIGSPIRPRRHVEYIVYMFMLLYISLTNVLSFACGFYLNKVVYL